MDNKNTKEKQVNYMYFPFDYGGIRGKIKQFFTAVCANTILLAELSPLYFGAAIGADQIIFARTGFADFWLWSILGYILLGAILAAVYLVCLYFGKAGVYLYDDSTVVIKSVITYRRTFQHTFPYLRYGKSTPFVCGRSAIFRCRTAVRTYAGEKTSLLRTSRLWRCRNTGSLSFWKGWTPLFLHLYCKTTRHFTMRS